MSSSSDKEIQIQKAQTMMEFGFGVFVPSFLALMMFSYILERELYPIFMGLSVLVAICMFIPAKKIHRLSYECWCKDTMPRTVMTSALGIIYITEVSIFAVSMLSFYEDLDPEQPLTLVVIAALVMGLIGVLAYNDKNKARYENTHKLVVKMDADRLKKRVVDAITGKGHGFTEDVGNRNILSIADCGLVFEIRGSRSEATELFLTVNNGGDAGKAEAFRTELLG